MSIDSGAEALPKKNRRLAKRNVEGDISPDFESTSPRRPNRSAVPTRPNLCQTCHIVCIIEGADRACTL